jgi:hypothetical protein
MRKISISILLANILTVVAFLAHTFAGDIELRFSHPTSGGFQWPEADQIWTMIRCGWYWVSIDLLFASIGLAVINFSNFFDNKKSILQILSFYFFGYAVVWVIVLLISNTFPGNFLKLGQWMLLLTISGLVYWGSRKYDN